MLRRLLPLAVLLTAPAGATAATWSPPQTVTVSGHASAPSVGIDAAGRIAVGFGRAVGGVRTVEVRRGRLAAGLVGPPAIAARLGAVGVASTSVALEQPSSRVALAWSDEAARSAYEVLDGRDGGLVRGTFPGRAHAPRAVRGPDGNVRFAWTTESGVELLAARLQGDALVDTTAAAGAGTADVQVAVAPDGTLVAAFSRNATTVLVATRAPGAAAWETEALAGGGFPRAPQVATGGDGSVHVAWLASTGSGNAVMTATRAAGAGTFAAPQVAAPSTERARSPRLVVASNGDVLVGYVATDDRRGDGDVSGVLRARRLTPAGVPSGNAARISGSRERTRGGAFATGPTGTEVVWSTDHSIRARRVGPALYRGAEVRLSGLPSDGLRVPEAAGGPSGGYVATWVSAGRVRLVRGRG
jgi:hypothetical protein